MYQNNKFKKIVLGLSLCIQSICGHASTFYVKPTTTGLGNGSSWANASNNLQTIIDAAASGDEIWVAAGTYKPSNYPTDCSNCTTNRQFAFSLKSGVSVYGGFAGTEIMRNQRNVANNSTILSGDIGAVNDSTDNCYHIVVAVSATVTLDGFTIRDGNANGNSGNTIGGRSFSQLSGGGIYFQYTTATLANNTVTRNNGQYGGGIFAHYTTSTLSYNQITYNMAANNAETAYGGGFYGYASNTTLSNNTISNNRATSGGGGIYTYSGMITLDSNRISENWSDYGAGINLYSSNNNITNNTITGNTATGTGGGIALAYSEGTNTVSNNIISGNSATRNAGGGIDINNGRYVLTQNTVFNNASPYGAGIRINSSTNTITKNIIFNNTATESGGGMHFYNGTITMNNNVFSDNSANQGGGIYGAYAVTTIANNTFSNNTANNGGGIYTNFFENTQSNQFINNIFWGNKRANSATVLGADYFNNNVNNYNTFKNNILQLSNSSYVGDSLGLGANASGNLYAQNPMFVNAADLDGVDNLHRTADDGLSLQAGSPAIGAGWASVDVPTTDLRGAARTTPHDLGAYKGPLTAAVQIAITLGNPILCPGRQLIFTATPTNGGTAPTYQWKRNGISVGTNSITYTDTQWANGDLIACMMVSNDPNVVTASATSSNIRLTVHDLPIPILTVGSATPVCQGDSVQLRIRGGVTYLWSNGKTDTAIWVKTNGTYSVSVTNSSNCSAIASQMVAFNTKPTVSFTQSLQVGTGSVVLFNNTSSTGTAIWYFGDSLNTTSTQLNPTFWYRKNGSYNVKLKMTNANGCIDSLTQSVGITGVRTGLHDLAEPLRIQLLPNPFVETLTIDIQNPTFVFGGGDRIMVTNALGQLIYQSVLTSQTISVDTRTWVEGIYHLSFYVQGQMQSVQKVVKGIR